MSNFFCSFVNVGEGLMMEVKVKKRMLALSIGLMTFLTVSGSSLELMKEC